MCLVLHARFYYWNGRMSSLVTRVNRRFLIIGDTSSVHESFRETLGLAAYAKDGLASAEEALFGSAAVAFIDSASRDPVSATTLRASSVSPAMLALV
jgi:ribose transport system substrate-binding protein